MPYRRWITRGTRQRTREAGGGGASGPRSTPSAITWSDVPSEPLPATDEPAGGSGIRARLDHDAGAPQSRRKRVVRRFPARAEGAVQRPVVVVARSRKLITGLEIGERKATRDDLAVSLHGDPASHREHASERRRHRARASKCVVETARAQIASDAEGAGAVAAGHDDLVAGGRRERPRPR